MEEEEEGSEFSEGAVSPREEEEEEEAVATSSGLHKYFMAAFPHHQGEEDLHQQAGCGQNSCFLITSAPENEKNFELARDKR